MSFIKVSENLQSSSPEGKRNFINSDETWAFTEQPKTVIAGNEITAHDLFNMFTADIIRERTLFTR